MKNELKEFGKYFLYASLIIILVLCVMAAVTNAKVAQEKDLLRTWHGWDDPDMTNNNAATTK